VCVAYCASFVSAQQCPVGEIEDCNGYCAPLAWLADSICDNELREYPPGSGYYVDFSCEEYMCDVFACEGCSGECDPGFAPDCDGNCVPVSFIQDGICDMGQRTYNGVPVNFSCQMFGCDMGDCAGGCWDDNGYGGLDDIGACCLGTTCKEMSREDCWGGGYTFIGNNTMCLANTCSCGENWVADCNGNCVPVYHVGGGYCANGELVDYGYGEFILDLDCLELACGLSGCVGVCPGGCCTGADCITVSFNDCIDIGGLFLGSYVSCDSEQTSCSEQQKPIQLPDTELYWSGKLGEVERFPQWIISEGDILVVGAVDNSTFEWKNAICVFRWDAADEDWVEEALLIVPSGNAGDASHAAYTTDGQRIAVTSFVQINTTTHKRIIDVFSFDGTSWGHEGTIDDSPGEPDEQYQWGVSLDILGDVLIVGAPMYNYAPDTNFGAAHIYHYDESTGWELDSSLLPWGDPPFPQGDDEYLGMSVALSDTVAAVASDRSILLYDITGATPTQMQHLRDIRGNYHPGHRGIDLENDRLMSNVGFIMDGADFDNETIGSRIFEYDGLQWVETAALVPFDVASSDWAGFIVELQGNRALMTSPRDNDLGVETGSAYIWEYDGANWHFISKLWSDRAVGGDQFGIGGTLHGSNAYLTGIVEEAEGDGVKVFWPRGISWITPEGGSISDSSNWDPLMPTISDSVSFSLRSQTSISVDDDFPFQQMFIGPGKYAFDLQGMNRSLGDGGETINLQGVPGLEAEFKLRGGILTVDGEIHIGEGDLPGKIAIGSNSEGQLGQLRVNGLYLQHDAGELIVELKTERPPLIQLKNVSPQLDGILSLHFANGYVPAYRDIIPLLTSEVVDDNAGQFSMVVIRDPLPDGLYIKLNYEGGDGGTSGSISAEVDLLENLFGYGEPNGESVSGIATDLVIAELEGSTRTDGVNEDIAVITQDTLYVFLSDGHGGTLTQAIYYLAKDGYSSLAAIDAGDLDGNGTIDLVVVNSDTNEFIPIFNEYNDISSFTIGNPVSTGPNPVDVLAMNLDIDADDDVVVACSGYSLSDGQIDFFEAVPGLLGGFSGGGSLLSPGNPKEIDPGDVNNDKDFQIYVSFGSGNSVGKAEGNATIRGFTWAYTAMVNVAIGPSKLVSGDLNGDLIDDVVVACPESDVICILRGLPDGSMAQPLLLDVGDEPTSLVLLDFDNDGDKDIASYLHVSERHINQWRQLHVCT